MNSIKGIVKLNLRQSKTAYLISAILFMTALASNGAEGNESLSVGNYLILLPLFMAIFIPAQNFTRTMNLGGKRIDFFKSGALTYLLVSAVCSAAFMILTLTLDRYLLSRTDWCINLYDVFGFTQNGAIVAFLQMTVFLWMFCCFLHTLTLLQGRWYGWAANVLIVAIISVFTPIAPLRAALAWFFNMIIFHDAATIQILSCLIVGVALYAASLVPIKRKLI